MYSLCSWCLDAHANREEEHNQHPGRPVLQSLQGIIFWESFVPSNSSHCSTLLACHPHHKHSLMAEQPDLAQAMLLQYFGFSSVYITELFVFVPGQCSTASPGACSPSAVHVRWAALAQSSFLLRKQPTVKAAVREHCALPAHHITCCVSFCWQSC